MEAADLVAPPPHPRRPPAEAASVEAWIEYGRARGALRGVLEIIAVYLADSVLDALKVPPPTAMAAGPFSIGAVTAAAAWGGVAAEGRETQAACARLRAARKVGEDDRIYACCLAARRETVAAGDCYLEVVEPTCCVGRALRELEKVSLPPPAAEAVREAFAARVREITSPSPGAARWFGVPTDAWIAAQVEIARESGGGPWAPPAVSLNKAMLLAKTAATIETRSQIAAALREWVALQKFSADFSLRGAFSETAMGALLRTPAPQPAAEDAAFWEPAPRRDPE